MRLVFLATGEIAIPTLEWVIGSNHDLAAVVTQPDKAVGRSGSNLQPPRVKVIAEEAGIPVLQPKRIRKPAAIAQVAQYAPDVLLVMAYGQILTRDLLDVPKLAPVNLHASLLPRHRGAAPVHAAILAGDETSGVTVMYVAEGVDTGDMLLKEELRIGPRETAGQLHDRIAALTPAALDKALQLLETGKAPRIPQDEQQATYAPKLDRDSGRLDWANTAENLDRRIRGLHPWPGAWTMFHNDKGHQKRLKIHQARPLEEPWDLSGQEPGKILRATGEGIDIICGEKTVLRIEKAQPEGKRAMVPRDLTNGKFLKTGMMFLSHPS